MSKHLVIIHSDNVLLTQCHEPPVALFYVITRSPVHGGSDTVNARNRFHDVP